MVEYQVQRSMNRRGEKPEYCPASLVSSFPANYAVAMMYIPMQTDVSMFDEMKALECGTLFPVLSKPFAGKCCK